MQRIIKWTAFLLVFSLLISATTIFSFAETGEEFSYTVTDDGVTITAYNGSATDVTIPAQINGNNVTAIGERAFANKTSIKTLSLPNTLVRIEKQAFSACLSLQSVSFPDSLQYIGDSAFFNCSSLKTITSTPYLYQIGNQAFHNTPWYTKAPQGFLYIGRVLYRYVGLINEADSVVHVPDHVAAIAPGAFEGQYNLSEVYLPVGIRIIGNFAFKNCYGLKIVRIPPSVTSIGNSSFLNAGDAVIYGVKKSTAGSFATDKQLALYEDATLNYADGDMNKDGAFTSKDIRILMRVLTLDEECDHERYLSSDIIYDGKIDTRDVREWMIRSIS